MHGKLHRSCSGCGVVPHTHTEMLLEKFIPHMQRLFVENRIGVPSKFLKKKKKGKENKRKKRQGKERKGKAMHSELACLSVSWPSLM